MPSTTKMHADELDIDGELVSGLIADQFPRWGELPVSRVDSAGTDNAMFQLGDDMVVRLPRLPGGGRQVEFEHRWLPRLAPRLPLAVPEPLAKGEPGRGYALPWGVYRWLDGDNAYDAPIAELADAAVSLGRFVTALRAVDATGGPASYRPGPLHLFDDGNRLAIRDLGAAGILDAGRANALADEALGLPGWGGAPVWLHADLLPGNLLTVRGRLTAVIDFGCLGVGEPTADTLPAWTVFTGESRRLFREAAEFDEATWERGRAWALRWGVGAVHYYRDGKNPVLAAVGRRAVDEALAGF
ncbi:aminoglycoside phosphotransferase family protein [Streptomyces griseorubiginosus]|uniref:aminoglycoside phosphotransferase family protein n=1 Tax=Streptomyces griseorubiginosus TaxID=67304 RepID=UPI002E80FB36|nr:aminoglycoside phosphotransferase family protein [Streptomyces griseorubiginosus]WUB47231.1 aminoglycoside phosphotransferase family protein [Streptomyces griseorubiginosus]WUB55755.1 aminoglycoside phosphotransferase family protein [Streptomyces griseorubiginosus]